MELRYCVQRQKYISRNRMHREYEMKQAIHPWLVLCHCADEQGHCSLCTWVWLCSSWRGSRACRSSPISEHRWLNLALRDTSIHTLFFRCKEMICYTMRLWHVAHKNWMGCMRKPARPSGCKTRSMEREAPQSWQQEGVNVHCQSCSRIW
jgi:hypothetical protein